MFKSLVVLGSLFAGYVSGGPVTPVTVVYDTVTSSSNVCDELLIIKNGGATNAVLGWYTVDGTAAVVTGTALEAWNAATSDPSTRDACANGLVLSMGVKYTTYANTDKTLVAAANTAATNSGLTSLYWDVEDMATCVQADVDFIAGSLAASTAMPIYLSVPAKYFSTKGPCGASISLEGAIETAYGVSPADVTKLAGIVVQYYNSGADFSTVDSMFVKAPDAAAGSAIAELNSASTKLKNKFIAGKLMKTNDNPDTTKPATDFTDLVTLDTMVCQATNLDQYVNGITLYKYTDGDATAMGAFATDCATATTPAPVTSSTAPTPTTTTTKASGSGATLMISSVAVVAGLAAIMN